MALNLDAIKAAASELKKDNEAKGPKKETEKKQEETKKKKSAPQQKYVIPEIFKKAIAEHLDGRDDMKDWRKRKDKSIDMCCQYIYDVIMPRASKERKHGESCVGICADQSEIFGLAVHYFDETEEALKKEFGK